MEENTCSNCIHFEEDEDTRRALGACTHTSITIITQATHCCPFHIHDKRGKESTNYA